MDFHDQDTDGIRFFFLIRSANVDSHIQAHALGLDEISRSGIDLRYENRIDDREVEKIQSPRSSKVYCGIDLGLFCKSEGYVLQEWKICLPVSKTLLRGLS